MDEENSVFEPTLMREARDVIAKGATAISDGLDTMLELSGTIGDVWEGTAFEKHESVMLDLLRSMGNANPKVQALPKAIDEAITKREEGSMRAQNIADSIETPVWDMSALA